MIFRRTCLAVGVVAAGLVIGTGAAIAVSPFNSSEHGPGYAGPDAELSLCLEKAGGGSSLEDLDLRRAKDDSFDQLVTTCGQEIGVPEPDHRDQARFIADMTRCLSAP